MGGVPDPVDDLVLDLLEWMGAAARPYDEVLAAWHTLCPRLPVWEEANARGFVVREHQADVGAAVAISEIGREFLATHRRSWVEPT